MPYRLSGNARQRKFFERLHSYLSVPVTRKLLYYIEKLKQLSDTELGFGAFFSLSEEEILRLQETLPFYQVFFEDIEERRIAYILIRLYYFWLTSTWNTNGTQIMLYIQSLNEKLLNAPLKPYKVLTRNTTKATDKSTSVAAKARKTAKNPSSRNYYTKKGIKIQQAAPYYPQATSPVTRTDSPSDNFYKEICENAPGMREFINQVKELPPALDGEKAELLARVKGKNDHAQQRLIEIYIPTALKAAMKISKSTECDLEETISIALKVLTEYFHDFQGDRNNLNWIKAHLERNIQYEARPYWICFPPESYNEQQRLIRIKEYCENNELSPEQFYTAVNNDASILAGIASKNNLSGQTIKCYYAQNPERLDAFASRALFAQKQHVTEYELQKYYDFQPPNEARDGQLNPFHQVSPYAYILQQDEITEEGFEILCIRHAFTRLTPREQYIIVARYGLNGQEPQALNDIAEFFHLTRERIRQIETKAINKIKSNYYGAKRRQINPLDATFETAAYNEALKRIEKHMSSKKSWIALNKATKGKEGRNIPTGKTKQKEADKKRAPVQKSTVRQIPRPQKAATDQQKPETLKVTDKQSPRLQEIPKQSPAPVESTNRDFLQYMLPRKSTSETISDGKCTDLILNWLEKNVGSYTLEEIVKANPELSNVARTRLTQIMIRLQSKKLIARALSTDSNGRSIIIIWYTGKRK